MVSIFEPFLPLCTVAVLRLCPAGKPSVGHGSSRQLNQSIGFIFAPAAANLLAQLILLKDLKHDRPGYFYRDSHSVYLQPAGLHPLQACEPLTNI